MRQRRRDVAPLGAQEAVMAWFWVYRDEVTDEPRQEDAEGVQPIRVDVWADRVRGGEVESVVLDACGLTLTDDEMARAYDAAECEWHEENGPLPCRWHAAGCDC